MHEQVKGKLTYRKRATTQGGLFCFSIYYMNIYGYNQSHLTILWAG
jgi:hypothetical protein